MLCKMYEYKRVSGLIAVVALAIVFFVPGPFAAQQSHDSFVSSINMMLEDSICKLSAFGAHGTIAFKRTNGAPAFQMSSDGSAQVILKVTIKSKKEPVVEITKIDWNLKYIERVSLVKFSLTDCYGLQFKCRNNGKCISKSKNNKTPEPNEIVVIPLQKEIALDLMDQFEGLLAAKPWANASQAKLRSVKQCDSLAANPADPSKVGPGVEFKNLNSEAAIAACSKAVKQRSDPRLQYQLGRSFHKSKQMELTASWYSKAANQGYSFAQFQLGVLYYDGNGVTKNAAKAVEWFRGAANQGNTDAQVYLGTSYTNGIGVTKDEQQGVKWYLEAAKHGNATAQYNLGVSYANGQGVAKNYQEAVKWYRKAANQGNTDAQYQLAEALEHGRGVDRNLTESVNWFLKLAKQGHTDSEFKIGYLYHIGKGVQQSDNEAINWTTKAAGKGHLTAINNLGTFYENGRGVQKDLKSAARLFFAAAQKGAPIAQGNIARFLVHGYGIRRNLDEGERYARLAAKSPDESVRTRAEKLLKQIKFMRPFAKVLPPHSLHGGQSKKSSESYAERISREADRNTLERANDMWNDAINMGLQ